MTGRPGNRRNNCALAYNEPARGRQERRERTIDFERMIRSSTTLKQVKNWDLNPFTHRHNQRLQMLRARLSTVHRKGGSFLDMIKMMKLAFAPSTAHSYASALAADLKRRHITITAEEKLAMMTIGQMVTSTAKRARLPTTQQLRRVLSSASPTVSATMTLQALSSARHGDLAKATTTFARSPHPSIMFVRQQFLRPWKSDKGAKRKFCRFFVIPTSAYLRLRKGLATYSAVNAALRQVDATPHSLRVWAMETLVALGTSFVRLQLLTGHTPTTDAALATRRYVEPHINQPESCDQLRLSAQLFKALFPQLQKEMDMVLSTLQH